jgi:hypothetical protein
MIRPKVACFSLAASFLVYLIPLVTPHGAWLLGQVLLEREAARSLLWKGANFAVALHLQFLAVAYFNWLFVKPGWRRGILLPVAFPFIFLTLPWVYLAAIPTRFLEEPDVAGEKISWPWECTVPGVYQANLSTASELWVRYSTEPNHYAMPC